MCSEDEVFAESFEGLDLVLVECFAEVLGGVGAAGFIAQDLGMVDGLGFNEGTQVQGEDFDFGQFRHGGEGVPGGVADQPWCQSGEPSGK